MLKDPPLIKQVMIREDDFLRGCQINGSLREIKKLKTSLSILKVNVSKSFTISLTTEQQMALENSTGARNIRNIWKTKNRFENLFKMVSFDQFTQIICEFEANIESVCFTGLNAKIPRDL